MSQQTGSNAIRLTQPAAGQTTNIPINAQDMRLQLGFEPDPNAVAKNGQNLEFSFEDGGKIVLEGYYDHFEGKTLPVMVTEGGDELSGEDFLASLNEDLLTAAGPGAGSAAGRGGVGEYADDAGSLVDGVGRLGSLGTIYWDGESEVPEDWTGSAVVTPTGSWDFGISTDLGFGLVGGVYEDGRPFQHEGNSDLYAARITMNINPEGETRVGEIRFSGLPEGTQIWIGDPNDGGFILEPGPDGIYRFSNEQFTAPGVFLIPPANSDADFDFSIAVDFVASGGTVTVEETVHVVVDAVADKPTDVEAETVFDAGFTHAAPGDEITIKVKASFDDYQDGSEEHYLLVELPAGWVNSGGYQQVEMNGKTFLKVPVDNATIQAGDGTVTVDVNITTPNVTGDTSVNLEVWAVAEEHPGDSELDLGNNIAMTPVENGIDVSIDVVTTRLSVSFSMYEDGQDQQHRDVAGDGKGLGADAASGDQNQRYIGHDGTTYATKADYDAAYPHGQPIIMKLVEGADGSDAASGTDKVTKITFGKVPDPDTEGTIYYNGVPVTANMVINDPVDLNGFTFKPVDNYSGNPTLEIRAEITSTQSGDSREDSAVHTHDDGQGNVVMQDPDAGEDVNYLHVESVADLATGDLVDPTEKDGGLVMDKHGEGSADEHGWFNTSHGSGESYTVEVELKYEFGDTDGSEYGTIYVLKEPGVLIYMDGQLCDVYTAADGTQYWIIAQGPIDPNNPECPFASDGSMNNSLNMTVVVDNDIPEPTLKPYIKTEEKGTDLPNDTSNDVAIREVDALQLPTFDSELTVKAGWGYEGNSDGTKHGGDAGTPSDLQGSLGDGNGVPIIVSFNGQNGESIVGGEIIFYFDPADGQFFWKGTECTVLYDSDGRPYIKVELDQAGDGPEGGLTFKPNPNSNADGDIKLQYQITVDDSVEGTTFTVTGETVVVIDAVADFAKVEDVDTSADNGAATLTAIISVKADFADDSGEGQYILVEYVAPADGGGWVPATINGEPVPQPVSVITVYYDKDGKPMQPLLVLDADGNVIGYDYNNPPLGWNEADGCSSKKFYQVGVPEGETSPYNVAVEWHGNGDPEDSSLATGTMVAEEGVFDEGNSEYNYNNNHAFDTDGEADINVVDSILGVNVNKTYEDHAKNQHQGIDAQDASSGLVTITIGKENAQGDVEGGVGGETLNTDGQILITFDYDGDGTPGTISYVDVNGITQEITPTFNTGTGKWEVRIDAGDLKSDGTQVQFRYNPNENDDGDLRNVNVSVPVTSDTGFNGTLETGDFDVVVDAVADKPITGGGSLSWIQGGDDAHPGYDKTDPDNSDRAVSWGDKITVTVSSTFRDLDGSENHYLIIEARDGWTCTDADGVIEIGGVMYFYKDVTSQVKSDGTVSGTFDLIAPADAASAKGDGSTIMNDDSIALKAGGLAVEGTIAEPADNDGPWTNGSDASQLDYSGLYTDGSDPKNPQNEWETDNNWAINTGNVDVPFNVINDGKGKTEGAYEDHDGNKHDPDGGNYGTVNLDSGEIVIALTDTTGKDYIVEGGNNILFFNYPSGMTPGTFTWTDGTDTYELTPVFNTDTGRWEVAIPDGAIAADGRSINLTYNPPAFDNTDLSNLGYTVDSKSSNSNAEGPVSGGIDTVDKNGNVIGKDSLIVDAVADKPSTGDITEATYENGTYVPGDVSYGEKGDGSGDPAEAAIPGGTVTVDISVTFRDVTEGGEQHYIAIKNGQWKSVGSADGLNTTGLSGSEFAGYTFIAVDGLIKDALAKWGTEGSPDLSTAFVYTCPDTGVKITLFIGADGHINATVDTTIEVEVPAADKLNLDGDTGSGSLPLEVGGVAIDRDDTAADGKGLTTGNDVAWDMKETDIAIETIGSTPSLSMSADGSQIYENLTPNAHLDPAEVEQYWKDYEAWQNGTGSEPTPPVGAVCDPATGHMIPDGKGAMITFAGLSEGETADIVLKFSSSDNADFSGGTVTVYIDGQPTAIVFTYDPVTGEFTLEGFNIDAYRTEANPDPKVEFEFKPGQNDSHADISVDYDVTITDDATGESSTWSTNDPGADNTDMPTLGINVDAVAQRPEFGDDGSLGIVAGGKDGEGLIGDSGVADKVEPGQSILIRTDMSFQDVTDGSQSHYLLVEATAANFKPLSITLSYVDADGNPQTITIPISDLEVNYQRLGDGMYYRIDVSDYLSDIGISADGRYPVEVTFELSSYGDSTDTSIRVGGMSHEQATEIRADGDREATIDNNTSVIISDQIPVEFGTKPTFSIGKGENWVSENDTSNAHVGDNTPDGGAWLPISVGTGCELLNLTIDMSSVTGGTLYYVSGYDANGDPVLVKLEAGPDGKATVPNDCKALVFKPDHNYSDTDIPDIKYEATVKNTETGQILETGGNITILVDAVAQQPTVDSLMVSDGQGGWTTLSKITFTHETKTAQGGEDVIFQKSEPIRITGSFPDPDGSETHFALVKAVANMTVYYKDGNGDWVACSETFIHKGEVYFKIPMGDGNSVDIYLEMLSRKLDINHTQDELVILVGTEETVRDGETNPDGTVNREQNYDNNIAISDTDGEGGSGGGIIIDHIWPDGHVIWVDPAYENDTPDADKGNTSTAGGGKIYFGSIDGEGKEPIVEAELTWDTEAGYIEIRNPDGTTTKYDSGSCTLTGDDLKNAYFVPKPNYSDKDVELGYKVTGDKGGTDSGDFPVVIDAVAQKPEVGAVDTAYTDEDGNSWQAVGDADGVGNEGVATIVITGTFEDPDGSEAHYGLLRKVPGYTVDGENVETIYLPTGPGGAMEAWYRVPMTQDPVTKEWSAEVDVIVDTFGPDRTYDIETRVMTEEQNYGGYTKDENGNIIVDAEVRTDNNVSWSDESTTVTIEYSPVDTTASITVTNGWENDGYVGGSQEYAGGGQITITLNIDEFDTVNSLVLSVSPSDGGRFVMSDGSGGEMDFPAGYINPDGSLDLFRYLSDQGYTQDQFNEKLAEMGLRYATDGYGDKDLSFSVSVGATDSKSGDSGTNSSSDTMIVDAVAHAPDVDASTEGQNDGSTATISGGILNAIVELSFEDVGTGEEHYAIMGQHQDWPVTGVWYYKDGEWHKGELTVYFDADGKPYYAMKIEDGMFETGSTDIKVRFDVQAPDTNLDITQNVQIGGASVEPNMGSPEDKETNLLNNWADNTQEVELAVGMVQATDVTLTMDKTNEDVPTQMIFKVIGGNDDSISEIVITGMAKGSQIVDENGNLLYEYRADGNFYDANGNLIGDTLTLDGQKAENGDYYFKAPDHVHGNFEITYEAKVTDDNSGAVKEFKPGDDGFSGSGSVDVTAIADKPLDLGVSGVDYDPSTPGIDPNDPTAAKPGSKVTFEVEATFPDHDGSENHFILVEYKAGWTCAGQNGTVVIGGVTYWKVPVTAPYGPNGEVSQTITLTPPSNLTADGAYEFGVGAMSQEKSNLTSIETAISTNKVTVDVGVADSTKDDIQISVSDVSEDALAAGAAQLTIDFAGLADHNDEVVSFSITNLQGGKIWDNVLQQYVSGTNLDIDKLKNGDYFYEPAENKSGDVTLNFTMKIKDSDSGHDKNVSGTITVDVTPVTDMPEGVDGASKDPVVLVEHKANITIELSADFKDYTGTEAHYFLVWLPAGATIVGTSYELVADGDPRLGGMTGPAYLIAAKDPAGTGTLTIQVDKDYTSADLTYAAGSYEKSLPDTDADKYQTTGQDALTINPDVSTFNKPPTLSAPDRSLNVLRGSEVDGKITMTDVDGDTVSVSTIKITVDGVEQTATLVNGKLIVEGKYGTLSIDPVSGEYTYTLNPGANPPRGYQEQFNITVSDGYGAANSETSGNLTITLTDANTPPTASFQSNVSGGGNVDELTDATGTYIITDADGDATSITGVTITVDGVARAATMVNGMWVVEGKYGTLTIDPVTGDYSYTRTDEFSTGQDNFTIAFKDEYGATGSGTLRIDAQGVNHAPVVTDKANYYNDASGTDITGMMKFADPDGDAVWVVSIAYNGVTYTLYQDGWNEFRPEGADFTIKIHSDGLYMFTPDEGVQLGDSHTFEVTVTDGNMTNTGELFFGKGAQEDFESLGDPAGAPLGDPLGAEVSGASANLFGDSDEDGFNPASMAGDAEGGILVGGSGEALFYDLVDPGLDIVWQVDDIASDGLDTILDFSIDSQDKLLFDDLLGVTGDYDAENKQLTLTVTMEENVSQDVVVTFADDSGFREFSSAYESAVDTDTQQALLTELIRNITGS